MAVSKTIAVILIVAGLCSVAVVGGTYAYTATYNVDNSSNVNVDSEYYTVQLYNGNNLMATSGEVDIDIKANTVSNSTGTKYSWVKAEDDVFTSATVKVFHQGTACAGTVVMKITTTGSVNATNFQVKVGSGSYTAMTTSGLSIDVAAAGTSIALKYVLPAGSNATSIPSDVTGTYKITLTYTYS